MLHATTTSKQFKSTFVSVNSSKVLKSSLKVSPRKIVTSPTKTIQPSATFVVFLSMHDNGLSFGCFRKQSFFFHFTLRSTSDYYYEREDLHRVLKTFCLCQILADFQNSHVSHSSLATQ